MKQIERLQARALRLPGELGRLGVAALVVIVLVAGFSTLVVQPMQATNAELQARAARQAPAAEAHPASPADKVNAVYAFLRKDENATDWLAKLHGIANATGVQLKSGNYRSQAAEGRIVRYQIVLPVTGNYVQIRDFLNKSQAEIPVMSIDQLKLRRESRNDGVVQAELSLTLHMVKT